MLSAVAARSGRGDHLGDLVAAVRPEFCGEVIAVSPEDPVFGRGRCGVLGCGRSAWARDLCGAHHQRWANHAKPDLGEFKESAAAVAVRAGSENVNGFDLSALAVGPRLEVAYVLQYSRPHRPNRHDRQVRLCGEDPSGFFLRAASSLRRPVPTYKSAVHCGPGRVPSEPVGLLISSARKTGRE